MGLALGRPEGRSAMTERRLPKLRETCLEDLDEAVHTLRALLADGPQPPRWVLREARENLVNAFELEIARRILGVTLQTIDTGDGPQRLWWYEGQPWPPAQESAREPGAEASREGNHQGGKGR